MLECVEDIIIIDIIRSTILMIFLEVVFTKSYMPNYNPKTEQLALGRGKRQKLDNDTLSLRISTESRQVLDDIASSYNCFYGGKPQISGLLERIASGELVVVPAPPVKIVVPNNSDQTLKERTKQHISKKYAPILDLDIDTNT